MLVLLWAHVLSLTLFSSPLSSLLASSNHRPGLSPTLQTSFPSTSLGWPFAQVLVWDLQLHDGHPLMGTLRHFQRHNICGRTQQGHCFFFLFGLWKIYHNSFSFRSKSLVTFDSLSHCQSLSLPLAPWQVIKALCCGCSACKRGVMSISEGCHKDWMSQHMCSAYWSAWCNISIPSRCILSPLVSPCFSLAP